MDWGHALTVLSSRLSAVRRKDGELRLGNCGGVLLASVPEAGGIS